MDKAAPVTNPSNDLKFSKKQLAWLIIICAIVIWSVVSWLKDSFSHDSTNNCHPTQITKQTKTKNDQGEIIGTSEEVIEGQDCDGIFIPTPDYP